MYIYKQTSTLGPVTDAALRTAVYTGDMSITDPTFTKLAVHEILISEHSELRIGKTFT